MSNREDSTSKATGRRLYELRRSNAAGKIKDRRTKRNRDRSAKNRNAIKDQDGI